MKKIYSIGHSNKSAEELTKALVDHGITDLIDVRTYPSSKYNPQFNRVQLERYLPEAGIKYFWRGKNIGGLAGNINFDETIIKIVNASNEERIICLMCSEAKPHECHRTQTIEPVIKSIGAELVNILWQKGTGDAKIEERAIEQNRMFEVEEETPDVSDTKPYPD